MDFIGTDPRTGDPRRPLLLVMHGYGADERDLLGILPALPQHFEAVSLRGPLRAANGGAAWATPPWDGPPAHEDEALVAVTAILQWLDERAPQRRIVPLGFSQGGLMVTELLRAQPARFDAGVVLSGFHGDRDRIGDADLAARRPPVFFGWGDADPLIPSERFRQAGAWLATHTALVEHVYPGLVHQISGPELADIAEFLDAKVPSSSTDFGVGNAAGIG